MDIRVITQPEELLPYFFQLKTAKLLAVHAETTGPSPHTDKLLLLQLTAAELPMLTLDCGSFLPAGVDLLQEILTTEAVKVFYDAKLVLQFLLAMHLRPQPLFDSLLAAQLLYLPDQDYQFSLKSLADQYLQAELEDEEQDHDKTPGLSLTVIETAAKKTALLLPLRAAMVPLLRRNGFVQIADIEFHCVQAMAHLEYYGIHLDLVKWQALYEKTRQQREEALTRLYQFTGQPAVQMAFWGDGENLGPNFDSNPFILGLLNDNGIPVTSTSRRELYPYQDHPLVAALSDYRHAAKSISTFLQPFPALINEKTGRLHPKYGQISTFSGRMSCSDPNIQQIPRDPAFRECFTAPPGRCLIIADYSQIELRVTAQISQDERMLNAYRRGDDLHQLTASLLVSKPMPKVSKLERQSAKAVNFGLIFGMGANGLQQYAQFSYGVPMTLEQATFFRQRFFAAYYGVKHWHEALKAHPARSGRTLAGRRYTFTETPGLPYLTNTPVQGTAADIVKKALGIIVEQIADSDTRIVAVVHDEILLECPLEQAEARRQMLMSAMNEAAGSILTEVPSVAEAVISNSWAEK